MARFSASRRDRETPGVLLCSSGQAPTRKSFNMIIPPVPPETYQAIASRITTFQPWLGQKAQLDKAQQWAQTSQDNLHQVQEELKELEDQRGQALRDVREVRQAETQEALNQLEKSMQQEFEESLRKKEEQWEKERSQMEKKIEDELVQLRTAITTEHAEEDSTSEEPPQKRAKLDGTEKSEEETKDEEPATEIEATKGSKETEEDDKVEEDTSKLSYAKKLEYEALKKKADELGSMKNNMGWLLVTMVRKEKLLAKNEENKDKI